MSTTRVLKGVLSNSQWFSNYKALKWGNLKPKSAFRTTKFPSLETTFHCYFGVAFDHVRHWFSWWPLNKVCYYWHKMWRTVPHTQQAGKRGFNRVPGCFVTRKRASQFDLKELTRDKTVKCQTGTCQVRPDSSIYTALKPLTTTYSYRELSANKL